MKQFKNTHIKDNYNKSNIIMDCIHEPTDNFDFTKLNLLTPILITGGNHFIKFRINEKPLYIQPPKCKTKQGIITKTGKRLYCDLIFSNENESFVRWIENLENYCQTKIFENRSKWFETDLDENDIENSFTQSLKLFKSGKYYTLKPIIPTILGKCNLKVFNEQEEEIDISNIKEDNDVMVVLEFHGIKCSPRNFQIDIEMKQMMVLNPSILFENCIFNKKKTTSNEMIETTTNEIVKIKEDNDNILENNVENIIENNNEEFEYNSLAKQNRNEIVEEEEEEIIPPQIQSVQNVSIPPANSSNPTNKENDIFEIDINLDEISTNDIIQIKKRNDVYYKMFKEAKRKAKIARDLALSSYLEAKNIKNTYLLDDIEDSDSDLDETILNSVDKI